MKLLSRLSLLLLRLAFGLLLSSALPGSPRNGKRQPMKLQNMIRMEAMVLGFAGVLLLASSARAQEIVNTSFDDGPNVAPLAQPAPAPVSSDLNSAAAEPQIVVSAAMISEPIVARGAGISAWTLIEGWLIVSLLVCIAMGVLYALSEAKRANRNLAVRLGQNRGK